MDSIFEVFKTVIPVLKHTLHKGECGRIGVIGGSKEYTGAPYFAGISAMRAGADGAHIFCPESAAVPIKSYNPDIIVHPILETKEMDKAVEEVTQWYPRLHSIVVGPGLGRERDTMILVKQLIWKAIALKKNIVIDADGLFLIQQDLSIIRGKENVVLTPNVMEFRRLIDAAGNQFGDPISDDQTLLEQTKKLSTVLGHVTVVCKGQSDIISNGHEVIQCNTLGSPRRVSGQGDILSGTMGLFLFWTKKAESMGKELSIPSSMVAAYASCHLVKTCNSVAFSTYGRSMLSSDMVSTIPEVFSRDFDNTQSIS